MSESVHPRHGHEAKHSEEHAFAESGIRTAVRERVHKHLKAFGRAVCAIWPVKPALHLAQLEDCTERAALYQINGERKVSAAALHAVDGEFID